MFHSYSQNTEIFCCFFTGEMNEKNYRSKFFCQNLTFTERNFFKLDGKVTVYVSYCGKKIFLISQWRTHQF